MNNPPSGKSVVCPKCNGEAIAIVPEGAEIVAQEENADGKVWVDCPSCGNRFLVYYRVN